MPSIFELHSQDGINAARTLRGWIAVWVLLLVLFSTQIPAAQPNSRPAPPASGLRGAKSLSGVVSVSVSTAPVNTFVPSFALGAGVDGQESGQIEKVYSESNIAQMLSARLKPLTYRLRTELGMEFWHWNPRGEWSDPKHQQGYWVSDSAIGPPVKVSYGYKLPRRGNTFDQADNDGYSRLDDGDMETYWKSNPYLDAHFTGEDNSLHPQWVVIDLKAKKLLNAAKILWGVPYATQYRIEYWEGDDDYYTDAPNPGRWRVFSGGDVRGGRGGDATLPLGEKPVPARFVRILMTASSGTAPAGSTDVRDGLGYAIREIYFGQTEKRDRFKDFVQHCGTNKKQTAVYASSTDPWHRAIDIDQHTEQPGLDLVFQSGLAGASSVMIPVALLFGTPENAVSEIQYLRARGYRFKQIEMGEEPDEQYITPEDYGSLYLQWASALHGADSSLELGGPSLETVTEEVRMWPNRPEDRGWIRRFLDYLRAKNRSGDYRFLSFEWYPFDEVCKPPAPQLAAAPAMLRDAIKRFAAQGLPPGFPLVMAEYGYSAYPCRQEVDIEGALLNADILGAFLTLGGDKAYFYGYEPSTLVQAPNCKSWGTLALFLSDDERHITEKLPAYYASVLITNEWTQEIAEPHRVYLASSDIRNSSGEALVTSYALRRPDGQWSLLLINKDPERSSEIRAEFVIDGIGRKRFFEGPVDIYQYSPRQYEWRAKGEHGYSPKDLPPAHSVRKANESTSYSLPAYSITVLRGRISN